MSNFHETNTVVMPKFMKILKGGKFEWVERRVKNNV